MTAPLLCAQECFNIYKGDCHINDLQCICSSLTFATSIESCTADSCPPADRAVSFNIVVELCANNGIPLSGSEPLPTEGETTSETGPETTDFQSTTDQTTFPLTTVTTTIDPLAPTSAPGSPNPTGTSTETRALQTSNAPTSEIFTSETPGPVSTPTSLSTGAKAGIAVGGAAGLILLTVGAFLLWRRRKKRSRGQELAGSGTDEEVKDNPVTTQLAYYEMDGNPERKELGGSSKRTELEDKQAVELAKAREDRSELA